MDHRREVGRGTSSLDLAAQPVGSVDLVGQHGGAFVQVPQQVLGDRTARLAGVRTSPIGRSLAWRSAWTLVVSRPRERPIRRFGWLFF
jgi:hypothetical protein